MKMKIKLVQNVCEFSSFYYFSCCSLAYLAINLEHLTVRDLCWLQLQLTVAFAPPTTVLVAVGQWLSLSEVVETLGWSKSFVMLCLRTGKLSISVGTVLTSYLVG